MNFLTGLGAQAAQTITSMCNSIANTSSAVKNRIIESATAAIQPCISRIQQRCANSETSVTLQEVAAQELLLESGRRERAELITERPLSLADAERVVAKVNAIMARGVAPSVAAAQVRMELSLPSESELHSEVVDADQALDDATNQVETELRNDIQELSQAERDILAAETPSDTITDEAMARTAHAQHLARRVAETALRLAELRHCKTALHGAIEAAKNDVNEARNLPSETSPQRLHKFNAIREASRDLANLVQRLHQLPVQIGEAERNVQDARLDNVVEQRRQPTSQPSSQSQPQPRRRPRIIQRPPTPTIQPSTTSMQTPPQPRGKRRPAQILESNEPTTPQPSTTPPPSTTSQPKRTKGTAQ